MKIDFWEKIECLHNEMYDAIVDLMNEAKITEIDFSPVYDKIDHGYITITTYPAMEVGVSKIWNEDGYLWIMAEDTDGMEFNKWISVQDDAVMASFSTLYDAVYDFINLK